MSYMWIVQDITYLYFTKPQHDSHRLKADRSQVKQFLSSNFPPGVSSAEPTNL